MTRDDTIAIMKDAYSKRAAGDKDAVAAFWAKGAQYRLAGDPARLAKYPTGDDPRPVIDALIDIFKFNTIEMVSAVVEGNKAAVHWKLNVEVKDRPAVNSELFDLWEFDEQGKVTSLLQFADTALLAHLIA